MRRVKANTDVALQSLRDDPEFKKWKNGLHNPTSKYFEGNKKYDDIEEIVFSDEEDNQDFFKKD